MTDLAITELQLPRGIWTPHAAVLCFECHGPNAGANRLDAERYEPHTIDEEQERGWLDPWDAVCDQCGKTIWMDYKIAWEQKVVAALKEKGHKKAAMDQTGGMCSAAGLYLDSDEDGGQKHIMITECDDGVEDPNNPLFFVSFFHYKNPYGDDAEGEDYATCTFDEAVALVEKIAKEGGLYG